MNDLHQDDMKDSREWSMTGCSTDLGWVNYDDVGLMSGKPYTWEHGQW